MASNIKPFAGIPFRARAQHAHRCKKELVRRLGELVGHGPAQWGYFDNQGEMALRFVEKVLEGHHHGLIISPMQSGKTGIIACIFYLLRWIFPDLTGIFVVANDQRELAQQNKDALEHLERIDLRMLSRPQRRDWEGGGQRPCIVFYDENHFGDGVRHSIPKFLEEHNLKSSRNTIFCGVSATPFTSKDQLEFEIWPDVEKLERGGYNSPRVMLRQGRVREADLLVHRVGKVMRLNETSQVIRHIEQIISRDFVSGYCMLRLKAGELGFVEQALKERFQERVWVKNWTMNDKNFSPKSYFRERRPGQLTIVLIRQKARMGNTIPTEHMHFMYEHVPNSFADTIMQSLVGRACGFDGKRDHDCVVYTHKSVVEAYDVFIRSWGDEREVGRAVAMLRASATQPSIRARLSREEDGLRVRELARAEFRRGACRASVIQRWIDEARRTHAAVLRGRGPKRTLSEQDEGALRRIRRGVWHPRGQDQSYFCGSEPGDHCFLVYDKYHPGREEFYRRNGIVKDWEGTVVKLFMRTGEAACRELGSIDPTDQSFHRFMGPPTRPEEGDEGGSPRRPTAAPSP